MTDGASQGLFVIVAVVIFGIFVMISYLIMRDTLKPSLANIFTDSIEQAEDSLDPKIITEISINQKTNQIFDLKTNQSREYYIKTFTDCFEFRDQDNEIIKTKKLDLEFKFHVRSTNIVDFEEFLKTYKDGNTNLRLGVTARAKTDSNVQATTRINGNEGITIF